MSEDYVPGPAERQSRRETLTHHCQGGRLASILLVLSFAALGPAHGANITITLNGTVDVLGVSVFGLTGSNLPVSTTFDVDSNAVVKVLTMATDGAAENFYGYQMAALSGFDVTFGTKMWAMPDLDLLIPKSGFNASIWFNSNVAIATPTRAWMQLSDSDGSIQFGSLTTSPDIALQSTISVVENAGGSFGNTAAATLNNISAVPEPGTSLLLLTSGVMLLLKRRARTRNW